MTDLTTTHLKNLLDQATPGPWEYDPGDGPDERYIGGPDVWGMCIGVEANGEGSSCSDADLSLAAAAPELAQEVIRLRGALEYLIEEALSAAENTKDATVKKRVAEAIKTAIKQYKGNHDE